MENSLMKTSTAYFNLTYIHWNISFKLSIIKESRNKKIYSLLFIIDLKMKRQLKAYVQEKKSKKISKTKT